MVDHQLLRVHLDKGQWCERSSHTRYDHILLYKYMKNYLWWTFWWSLRPPLLLHIFPQSGHWFSGARIAAFILHARQLHRNTSCTRGAQRATLAPKALRSCTTRVLILGFSLLTVCLQQAQSQRTKSWTCKAIEWLLTKLFLRCHFKWFVRPARVKRIRLHRRQEKVVVCALRGWCCFFLTARFIPAYSERLLSKAAMLRCTAVRHSERSCAKASQLSSKWHFFSVILRVSLYRRTWPPWARVPRHNSTYKSCFGMRKSGMRATWPLHLNLAFIRREVILMHPDLRKTSSLVIKLCHRMFSISLSVRIKLQQVFPI